MSAKSKQIRRHMYKIYTRKKMFIITLLISSCILFVYRAWWGVEGYTTSIILGDLRKQGDGTIRGNTNFVIWNDSNKLRKVQLKMRGRLIFHLMPKMLANRELQIDTVFLLQINGESVEKERISNQEHIEIPANTHYVLSIEGVVAEGECGDNSRFAPYAVIYNLRWKILVCFSIGLICMGVIIDRRKIAILKREEAKLELERL